MKGKSTICIVLLLALAVWEHIASPLSAQTGTAEVGVVPRLVRFAGSVKDDSGKPLTGITGLTLALYKDQQGGAALWIETQTVHLDSTGHYTVLIGSSKPAGLPTELFTSGDARWLGITPEGQGEQPRVLLTSTPYALKAGDAETIGGLPASAFVRAPEPSSESTAQSSANPAPMATITGTGAANYVTMWTGTSTLGKSPLFAKSGNVGIGTTAPGATLDVNGTAKIRGSTNVASSSGLQALSVTATGSLNGLGSQTNWGSGYAIVATNTATSGAGGGLYGHTSAPSGVGVVGEGSFGVEGVGTSTGVYGNGPTAGVYGIGTSAGVSGVSTNGFGVVGTSQSTGVYGNASNIGGYGVEGHVGSPSWPWSKHGGRRSRRRHIWSRGAGSGAKFEPGRGRSRLVVDGCMGRLLHWIRCRSHL